MAIAHDVTVVGTLSPDDSTSPLTWSSGSTSASATVGIVYLNFSTTSASGTSVDWGGSAMTRIFGASVGTSTCEIWAVKSPPSGVKTITLTWTTASSSVICFSGSYTGQATPALPTTTASNSSASASVLSVNISVAVDQSWVLGLGYEKVDNTAAWTAGLTRRVGNNGAGGSSRLIGDSNAAQGTGTFTSTLDFTGTGNIGIVVCELPQTEAGAAKTKRQLMSTGIGK